MKQTRFFFIRRLAATGAASLAAATLLLLGAPAPATAAAAPELVKDITIGIGDSNPGSLVDVNGTLFFTVGDMDHFFGGGDMDSGWELWKSDGTEAGTVLVKELVKDTDGMGGHSHSDKLVNVNGTLFFSAADGDGMNGEELWKSDGTTAGTVQVKDIFPGTGGSAPENLVNVNGTLFFTADDGVNGRELWKSDGTEAGTVLVKVIYDSGHSFPRELANVNGTLFFAAEDGVNGRELWKSDGTEAGTVLVKDINANGSSWPLELANVNGTLFFSADDGVNGRELWKSDGTAGGTVLVKDINSGTPNSWPAYLVNVNGTLFFIANDGVNGYELWKSDGTEVGTVLVKVIYDSGHSTPRDLVNVNGTLFFNVFAEEIGRELWKSDGTEAGTVLVRDIRPGNTSSPENLVNVNGTLFFSADDGLNGRELWKSDGTEAGTELVENITGDSGSSNPRGLTLAGEDLFFAATRADVGRELFRLAGAAGNLAPTDILLSNSSVIVNQAADTVVGTLTAVDANANDTHTFTFVAGEGDADNASFTITDDVFKTAVEAAGNGYSIRLRTTDAGELTFEKTFTINVLVPGTEELPYQISTWDELHDVRNDVTAHYQLVNDLDETTAGYADHASAAANAGAGWLPIGTNFLRFTGSFDGNGHTLTGLNINRDTANTGLFGFVGAGGHVMNVGLVGGSVSSGSKSTVGVLVGDNAGSVSGSYATGTVSGHQGVGGLVGFNTGFINMSYATGTVSGNSVAGGLVGFNSFGSVTASYATGAVTGGSMTGGLTGHSTGTVSASYWNTETSGRTFSSGGTGLTTSQMTGAAATTNMTAFDFTDTWETVLASDADAAGDGYPILRGLDRRTQLEAANNVPVPETNHALAGTLGDNDWYQSDVEVTLSVIDHDGSGIAATYHKIGDNESKTYSDPFTVSGEGKTVVAYWSEDNAGGVEPEKSVTIGIDTVAPATTVSFDGLSDGASGWIGDVTVTLTPTDASSGVTETFYTVDGGDTLIYSGPFVVGGTVTHTITSWSIDNAGNIETVNSTEIDILPIAVPDHYATLAEAIAVSRAGDTIMIAAGTYTETGLTITKDLTILGAGDGEGSTTSTLLQTHAEAGTPNGRVINIEAGATVVISGVRIRHGLALNGGGIHNAGHLTLLDSTVTGNVAGENGGGIYNWEGTVILTNSSIDGNHASVHGGGIYITGILLAFTSAIVGNTAGGSGDGLFNDSGLADVRNNWWGHSSGPQHAVGNPNGLGDEIFVLDGTVLFDPWYADSGFVFLVSHEVVDNDLVENHTIQSHEKIELSGKLTIGDDSETPAKLTVNGGTLHVRELDLKAGASLTVIDGELVLETADGGQHTIAGTFTIFNSWGSIFIEDDTIFAGSTLALVSDLHISAGVTLTVSGSLVLDGCVMVATDGLFALDVLEGGAFRMARTVFANAEVTIRSGNVEIFDNLLDDSFFFFTETATGAAFFHNVLNEWELSTFTIDPVATVTTEVDGWGNVATLADTRNNLIVNLSSVGLPAGRTLEKSNLYVQPGDPIVVSLDAGKLDYLIEGVEVMFGFSTDYFVMPADPATAWEPISPWDAIIHNVWGLDDGLGVYGQIDTGIMLEMISAGTDADGSVAEVTLDTTAQEGTTVFFFRLKQESDDPLMDTRLTATDGGEAFFLTPFTMNTGLIVLDGTPPSIDTFAAVQERDGVDIDLFEAGAVARLGTVEITVESRDELAGIADDDVVLDLTLDQNPAIVLASVLTLTEEVVDGIETWTRYTFEVEIDAETANGTYNASVQATDRSGNPSAILDGAIVVDKNRIAVVVALQGVISDSFEREVVFTSTGIAGNVLESWTRTLTFVGGVATTHLDEAPDGMVNLSAKARYSLRVRLSTQLDLNGQAEIFFDETNRLRTGDINGDNVINMLDVAALRSHWLTENDSADLTGNGSTNLSDMSLLQNNWLTMGDEL